MDKISTSELVKRISEATGLNLQATNDTLIALVNQINFQIANDRSVQITGLGKFYPKDREARNGRHPVSGEEIIIPAKRVLSFKATKKA